MTNGPNTLNNIMNNRERLDGFKRKSEVQRQAHADLSSKYNKYIIGSSIFNIFASGIIVFLALSDPKKIIEPMQLLWNHMGVETNLDYALLEMLFAPVLGLLGLSVFLLSLLGLICGWSDKVLRHSEGVRLFTDLITDIRDIVDGSDSIEVEGFLNETQIREIKKRYILICSILPLIPDRDFLKSKEKYLAKREKSEEMEKK